jgi:hypothetical protein
VEDKGGIAFSLEVLASVALDQAEYTRAGSLLEENLALRKEERNKGSIAFSLWQLGRAVLFSQGDWPRARSLCEESLALYRELGYKGSSAYCIFKQRVRERLASQSVTHRCCRRCCNQLLNLPL